ncbi:hypothetical protein BGX28_002885 [Mortierella sp. GBA30]|nr:hypothetical protein BGX28_002885 [Mortierella sp. GBA30]
MPALRLLQHLLASQDQGYHLDYEWAYNTALRIGHSDDWIETLCRDSPAFFFTMGSFQTFVREILPRHRAHLIRTSFDIHMSDASFSIPERTRRSRATNWTMMLIEDSLRRHEQNSEYSTNPHNEGGTRCDKVIEHMARYLHATSGYMDDGISNWHQLGLKEVALGLALHTLYTTVTESSVSQGNMEAEDWIQILETPALSDIRLSDFDVVVKSYGTLTNLNALALMLDAVGLYSLSMKLINRMLSDFYALEKNTRKELGHSCDVTKEDLQAQLREVEQRRILVADKDGDGWRYDDFLEDWIERTPASNKTKTIQISNISARDEDDPYLITRSEPLATGNANIVFDLDVYDGISTPPRRTRVKPSYYVQDLRDSPVSQISPRGRRPMELSPFILKDPIRYSMTPIHCPASGHQQRPEYGDWNYASEEESNSSERMIADSQDWLSNSNGKDTDKEHVAGQSELESEVETPPTISENAKNTSTANGTLDSYYTEDNDEEEEDKDRESSAIELSDSTHDVKGYQDTTSILMNEEDGERSSSEKDRHVTAMDSNHDDDSECESIQMRRRVMNHFRVISETGVEDEDETENNGSGQPRIRYRRVQESAPFRCQIVESNDDGFQERQSKPALRSKRRRTASPVSLAYQRLKAEVSPRKRRVQNYALEGSEQFSSDDSTVSEYKALRSKSNSWSAGSRSRNYIRHRKRLRSGSTLFRAKSRQGKRKHQDDDDDYLDDSDTYISHDRWSEQDELTCGSGEFGEQSSEATESDGFAAEDDQDDDQDDDEHEHDEYDGDITINIHKEQLDIRVGAPLPLTEPDELAFWI